jgi:DNA-binding MarR family transcriptional regulator/N-acetylglutamate synthase-like GNAT family acetyltransferase
MDPGAPRVAAVRRFNRFYTGSLGLLDEGLLDTPWSLSEARLLYELAQRRDPTATELGRALRLNLGYLSRLLRGLERRGMLGRRRSEDDARRSHLRLTAKGRRAAALLDSRSQAQVRALLEPLPEARQAQLVESMAAIERLLGAPPAREHAFVLRTHRPGDLGWIVSRHGALYHEEYGFNEEFEALVAEIVAGFVRRIDPARERCWIAERDGVNAGSVMLVRQSRTVAKLRLLLVEPWARGFGIGRRLVDECLRHARQCGYRRMVLWTQSNLVAARAIYRAAGFTLVRKEPHRSFGHDLVGEFWQRAL